MGKSTHFIGQPLYSQVIKLLCKSKILQISEELGGERYTKRFNVWIHLIVMLYAVIKRFDSLREITTSLLADTHKLAHIGIRSKSVAVRLQMPTGVVRNLYLKPYIAICTAVTGMNLYRTADAASPQMDGQAPDHRLDDHIIVLQPNIQRCWEAP